MDDKKRVKKATVKDLKKEVVELTEEMRQAQEALLNQAETIARLQDNNVVISNILSGEREVIEKLREVVRNYEERDIPVNGCAEAGPPRLPEPVFRVITNGKRYSAQKSLNSGETWLPVQEVIRQSTTVSIKELSRWTRRGARKYLRKQYGEEAIILSREWRAV